MKNPIRDKKAKYGHTVVMKGGAWKYSRDFLMVKRLRNKGRNFTRISLQPERKTVARSAFRIARTKR